jgi:peroxiredoxin
VVTDPTEWGRFGPLVRDEQEAREAEMAGVEPRPPVQPGEPAQDFTLPAADRPGSVSLADYRGRSPLLLALFRGLYCPLCRRQIVQMGLAREKLLAVGVEMLGVVATKPEHARLYFRLHPARVPLAADPDMTTLRAYGVPKPSVTPERLQAFQSLRVDPYDELPEPVPITEVAATLNRLDGYEFTQTDQDDRQRQWRWDHSLQLVGQFLIDRGGIVRWSNIECAKEGMAGFGKFPADEELLAAAQQLVG